jgi:hypothetical protein
MLMSTLLFPLQNVAVMFVTALCKQNSKIKTSIPLFLLS